MALNALGLGFIFTARDRATATVRRVGSSMDGMGRQFQRSATVMGAAAVGIGAAIATVAGGVGALRGAFNLAQQSSEFGLQIARVGAISRASSQELQQLEERAVQAGIATQFSPTEAAEGLNELAVRGFNAQQSMTALSGVLDLAAGGGISVAQSAQSVGAALRVFGLEANQSGYAVDRLLRISNVTALEANDLALALGNVSRGAGLTRQSLEEMLPAIGLVRNTGVEASVASNAVSSALLFMANNATKFRQVGVEVTDAEGNFRPFMDIIMETQQALTERFPNAAQRSARAIELFGRFGVTAFNAVSEQTRAGVRDTEGNLRRGADAVNYLRETMQNATGAAEEFREQLLNTFRGQLTLLQGTVQTLGVVLGSPFARAFRPFVEAITNTLNVFIRLFRMLPNGLQTLLASSVLAGGALMIFIGIVTAVAAGVALLIPIIETVGIVLGVIAVAMAPVTVGLAALGATIATTALLVRRNVGGIADFISNAVKRVRLAFRALSELFGRGGFSQEVDEALQGANRPIRTFAVTVYRAWHRLRRLWNGIRSGIDAAVVATRPAVEAFIASVRRLGRTLGFASEPLNRLAGTPSERFKNMGITIGKYLGRAFTFIVDVARQVIDIWNGLVRAGRIVYAVLAPVFSFLADQFRELWRAVQEATGQFSAFAGQGRDGASWGQVLGMVIATVIGPAIMYMTITLGIVVRVISSLIRLGNKFREAYLAIFNAITHPVETLRDAWVSLRISVMSTIRTMLGGLARVGAALPAPARAALGFNRAAGLAGPAQGAVISDAEEQVANPGRALKQRVGTIGVGLERATAAQQGMALGGALSRRPGMTVSGMTAEQAQQLIQAQLQQNAIAAANRTTIVQIDGQEVFRSVAQAARANAAASGAPVIGSGEV